MKAYELLAKLRHLTLWGQDVCGELEWVGTYQDWVLVEEEKKNILAFDEIKKAYNQIWK